MLPPAPPPVPGMPCLPCAPCLLPLPLAPLAPCGMKIECGMEVRSCGTGRPWQGQQNARQLHAHICLASPGLPCSLTALLTPHEPSHHISREPASPYLIPSHRIRSHLTVSDPISHAQRNSAHGPRPTAHGPRPNPPQLSPFQPPNLPSSD